MKNFSIKFKQKIFVKNSNGKIQMENLNENLNDNKKQ